jgi:arabinogalactan oligomer/maltooligosaccharide transport system permease protein
MTGAERGRGKEVSTPMATQAMTRPAVATRGRVRSFTPYLFLAPALVTITLLTVFPMLSTVGISFTNYNLYHPSPQWIGFKNYLDTFAPDSPFAQLFLSVFIWTLIFSVVTTVLNYFVGLILAIALNNQRLPERAIYRTLLIVPWALPATITVLIWNGLLNDDFGAINAMLVGLHLPKVAWLLSDSGTRAAIFIVNLWLGFPFQMIVALGGLQSVPGDVYEAASVDGATALQRLYRITLPLVVRVTLPAALLTFSYNFTNFGIIYLLNQGGPPRTDTSFAGFTDTLVTFIYKLTLTFDRYDRAAALAIIVFILVAALSIVGFRITGAFKEIES